MPFKKSKYYSSKRIVVKPKVHWALYKNMQELFVKMPQKNTSNVFPVNTMYTYTTQDLCNAGADSNYQPGLTKKVKHIKIDITRAECPSSVAVSPHFTKLKAYIVFLPQGVNFDTTGEGDSHSLLSKTLVQHPEWIMAERNIDVNVNNDVKNTVTSTISCKLSRNLKSGDKIILVLAGLFINMTKADVVYSEHKMPYIIEWSHASCI